MRSYHRKSAMAAAVAIVSSGLMVPVVVHAQTAIPTSNVTIYGTIEMALESNTNGTTGRTAIQNFSSNFGLKGERAFNSDLSGIFQLESGVAPDDGATQSKALASRNSYVGLRSLNNGTLIMGTHDMPLKTLAGTTKIMLGEGEVMETIIHGRGSSQSVGSAVFGQVHTRQTNVLLYTSPKFSNLVGKLAYSPDEGTATPALTYSKPMYGGSLEFNDGTFNAGLAFQALDNFIAPTATASGSTMQGTKLTVGAVLGDVKFGAAYSVLDNNAGRKTNNYMVSGAYTMAQYVFKANYGVSSETASGASDGLRMAGLEADYVLDKDTTLYVGYSQITNDKNAKGYYTQSDNFPAAALGTNPSALNFGIQFKF